jgi:hypothetical protein
MDSTDYFSPASNFPAIVGTTKIDNIEMMTRDVMFDLDDVDDEAPNIPSPISTEMFDDDQPIRAMDATFEFSNIHNFTIHYNDHHNVTSETDNKVKLTHNDDRFCHYELRKAKLHYNRPLKAVDCDDDIQAEMASIFQTPYYQLAEAKEIITRTIARPITKVLLTLYTTYHLPLSDLFLLGLSTRIW